MLFDMRHTRTEGRTILVQCAQGFFLMPMKGGRGGSSTPSYRKALASKGKKPVEDVRETGVEGEKSTEVGLVEPIENNQYHRNEKEVEDKQ